MRPTSLREYPVEKILIIGLSSLGDNLLISGAVKLIRDTYKKARMEIVVGRRSIEFARDNPWFSGYFIFDKVQGVFPLIRRLRAKRYDLIVDFRNSLIPFFLRGKYKLMFFREEMLSDKFYTHESERTLGFLEPYFGRPAKAGLVFPVNNADRARVDAMMRDLGIRKSDPLVVLNPGASFPPKRWPKERFAEVGATLAKEYRAKIVVIGGQTEKHLAADVGRMIGPVAYDCSGKTTVGELSALLERAHLLVTNDTGPMHLASAVECPVVAIFGPGNPYRYGPIGTKAGVVHDNMECFPCRLEGRCRKGFVCLNNVTVEDVLKAARLLLDEEEGEVSLFDLDLE